MYAVVGVHGRAVAPALKVVVGGWGGNDGHLGAWDDIVHTLGSGGSYAGRQRALEGHSTYRRIVAGNLECICGVDYKGIGNRVIHVVVVRLVYGIDIGGAGSQFADGTGVGVNGGHGAIGRAVTHGDALWVVEGRHIVAVKEAMVGSDARGGNILPGEVATLLPHDAEYLVAAGHLHSPFAVGSALRLAGDWSLRQTACGCQP